MVINGVKELKGTSHTILPDMIEIGSFIGLAAITKSEITIKNVAYEKLGVIPDVFAKLGIKMERKGDDIFMNNVWFFKITEFNLLTIFNQRILVSKFLL